MSDRKRVLRIHVAESDKQRVNITVPLGLARLAKLGGVAEKLKVRHGIDLDEILDEIDEMPDGKIVDVIDDKSGDHIEIFVETPGSSSDERRSAEGREAVR
jgi:hypothetical protein